MNIFEELDNLVKIASGKVEQVNESESKPSYDDIPIDPNMENEEQARLYVRDYFAKLLEQEGGTPPPDDIPEPPKKISGPKPPPPPFKRKDLEEGGAESKDWEEDEVLWDEEDAMEELEMEADELDDEDELEDEMEKDYDDFNDDEGGASGSGGDSGDDDDEDGDYDDDAEADEDGESGEGGEGSGEDGDGNDGESGEGGEGSGEGGSGKGGSKPIEGGFEGDDLEGGERTSEEKKGKDGEKSKTDSKKDTKTDGDPGGTVEPGTDDDKKGSDALKSSIEDAINRLKERADADKEQLKKLSDMAKEGTSSEDIEDVENKIDAEKDGKSIDSIKDLIGKMEQTPSDEDLKKEVEDSKISDEDKKELLDSVEKATTSPTVIDDDEMKKLKSEAVKELEKKCEGHSSLSNEILYHSMKDAKIASEDWKKILEQILKEKSIHSGSEDSKIKKSAWGNKNHLWRGSILPTKVERRGGGDTQSIYCFVDYSGSVRSQSTLIISFLGRVMELCMNLKYTDMVVYTFADELSLPKRLTKDMIDKDGYEKVLAQTIAYFEEPTNDVGGSIEDFSLVADEINRIKMKDKGAVAFIFGDGVWTFYGNSQPPIRLKEMCNKWLKDICAFVFYNEIHERLQREIEYLKDVAGVKNVITTKISDIKPTFDD